MEETGLIVVGEINPLVIFTEPEGVDKILSEISSKVADFEPDLETVKGRKEIASMAHKVSRSKIVLDDLGKNLVADWKQKAKVVDASRKTVRDSLDALRDEVRQPLTDWEAAEKARLEAEKLTEEVEAAHTEALAENSLSDRQKEIEAKEAEFARIEAERLAKEESERQEKERLDFERVRQEQETQRVKEAAAQAQKEAEEAAQQKILDAERKEREAKEAAERSEREKVEAAKRAEESQKRAVAEAEERARVEAENREQERLAKEAAERKEAELKAADVEHRRTVNQEALTSIVSIGVNEKKAKEVIKAIASGLVAHVKIVY